MEVFTKGGLLFGVSLGSWYMLRRSRGVQIGMIQYKIIRKTRQQQQQQNGLKRMECLHKNELEVLKSQLHDAKKPCIMFVSGPEGSGSSTLVEQAIEDLPHVLKLDLYREQISTGSGVLEHILRRSGYYSIRQNSAFGDIIGVIYNVNNDAANTKKKETDLALNLIEHAFLRLKAKTGTYPCLVVDQLHALKDPAFKSTDFARFIQFAIHMATGSVANIVFCSRDDVVFRLDREYQSLQRIRVHIPVQYPRLLANKGGGGGGEEEKEKEDQDETKKGEGSKEEESQENEEEAKEKAEGLQELVDNLGGNLTDINLAKNEHKNTGEPYKVIIGRMVQESSLNLQQSLLDSILEQIQQEEEDTKRLQLYYKYNRCWEMLLLFAQEHDQQQDEQVEDQVADQVTVVPYDNLVLQVFGKHKHEIESYVNLGVLRYVFPQLMSQKSFQVSMAPSSRLTQKAMQSLVNKPGLKELALEIKKTIAKRELAKEEQLLQNRIATLLNVHQVIEHDQSLQDDMQTIYEKISNIWKDFDDMK